MVGSIDLLAAWAEDGDWVALGALADELEGTGDQAEYAALVRRVYEERDRAILFMYGHGHGCRSYAPMDPMPADGQRLRAARLLAYAEHRVTTEAGWGVTWHVDHDADRSWMDEDDGRDLWGCVVGYRPDDKVPERLESLWGIDLGTSSPDDDPYARVVVAQLALALIRDDELPQ